MAKSPDEAGLSTSDATEQTTHDSATTVAKGAMILAIGTFVSRILGWYREKLLLGIYGDSDIAGAYISAFNIPDLLYYLLAGGALSAAFIPIFSAYLAKKQFHDSNRVGSTIANLMLVAIAIGTAIELLFAPYFVKLMAPGYAWGSDVFNLTVALTRILCFMVFFTALSGLFTGMLNSYHHFLATTLVWNTYNLGIIFGMTVLRKFNWGPHGIYGVAGGVLIGAFSLAAIQLPVLLKYGFRYQPVIDVKHEGVKKVLLMFVPVMVAFALMQISLQTIPQILATYIGAPAVTDTRAATRLVLLPLGIFAVAISTAAFPRLAQQVALGQKDEFRATFGNAMKAILILTIPATVGMFVLAEPLTFLLWGGDEYGANGVRAAAYSLSFFVWALLGISIMQVANRAFFSLHKTLVPMLIAVGIVVVGLPMSYFLLRTPLSYGALAFTASITLTIGCFVQMELLRRELGGINGAALVKLTAKVLLASVLMGAAVYAVTTLKPVIPTFAYSSKTNLPTTELVELGRPTITPHFQWSAPAIPTTKPKLGEHGRLLVPRIKLLIQVLLGLLVGAIVYLAALWLLRVNELTLVSEKLLKRFRRKSTAV